MVRPVGVEPTAFWSVAKRSIQLSYGRIICLDILDYILKTYKIDGIECFYTTFTKEQSERLVELCKDRNLYMSGGSDYHGKAKPNVDLGVGFGEMRIEESIIDEWKNKVTYYK